MHKDALEEFNISLITEHKQPDIYLYRAEAQYNLGDSKQALIDIENALFLNPEYDYAYYWKAKIKTEAEQFDEAFENINKAIALDTSSFYFF